MAHDRPDVTVHPGMMFSGAKDLMESTILWRIVRAMPKGCLLHAHLDAMVDFRWLIDEVLLEEPGMHITAVNGPLDSEEAMEDWENGRGKLEFKWYKEERRCGLEESIWSSGYTAGEPRLLAMEAERFPDGGRRGFVEWLKRRCTLSALDAREHHHGVDAIWRKFYACFATVGAMTHYEPIFRKFLRRLMLLLWEDGIWWVETRYVCGR